MAIGMGGRHSGRVAAACLLNVLVVLLLGPAAASQIPVIILSAVTAYVVAELLASRRTSRAAMQPAPGVTAEN
jgi:MFS superfamily sulfate permease-like transporter